MPEIDAKDLFLKLVATHIPPAEIEEDLTFFELGGTSLQAVQLIDDVASAFGVQLEPITVLTHQLGQIVETKLHSPEPAGE